jgi:methyl-accepting chemotaxis protein
MDMGRPSLRRRRFYVHGIQRKYIFLSLVPLLISSFLIIVFLFVPLDVLLYSSASPAAKEAIVQDLRALGFRIWPAIFLAMLVSTFLSVFVTHRFAGPLYRFHQVVDQMAAGDLSTGFKLRKGDDLVELETALNRAIESLAATMQEAHRPLNDLTVRLETLAKQGRGTPLEQELTVLLERAQEMHKALGRLKIAREQGK